MDSSRIITFIEKLRKLTRVSVQKNWRYFQTETKIEYADIKEWERWPLAELNEKGQIKWSKGKKVLWAIQKVKVPRDIQGYSLEGLRLKIAIAWWAEDAEIYLNGKIVQRGDLFDNSARILLTDSAKIGEEFIIAVKLVSPGHDDGALVQAVCIYESKESNRPEPGFIADEFAVLYEYFNNFAPEKLESLLTTIEKIDWKALPDKQKFERSLFSARQTLVKESPPLKQRHLLLLSHSHLDLAWLWPVSETWQAAQRTFESVLTLQKDFPSLIYCHSTPALYEWIEKNRPDLFAAIKEQVKANRWEIVGSMWVEPELNIISGESLVRQILYGQRYTLEKFHQLMSIAWVPDSFGFCWQLPQILKKGGVKYFVTQKLRWNDTTKFPYGIFWWQAPDGSKILSFISAPIGENIEPIKMIKYACEWEKQTGLKKALWLPGVGDHGGGPTRDMLEIAQRWEKSPFFPRLEFSTAIDYLQKIEKNTKDIPVWKDELYLEFHRGCYTTHAEQKRYNRRCEDLLYQAELLASLANITTGFSYPKKKIETAWKKVLFNQFHDILPGSSITEVYVEANREWKEAEKISSQILTEAIKAIAKKITLPKPPQPDALPIVIFNALNWERSQVVSVTLPSHEKHWQIFNLAGEPLPSQISDNATLLFLAKDIPAVGYSTFWLCHRPADKINRTEKLSFSDSSDWVLENEFLRVTIDANTGNIASLFDKINNREVIQQGGGGNQLQAFEDKGQYWDAWNIDPNYNQHPLPSPILKEIRWLEKKEVRSRLQVVRQLGKSEFYQDYILEVSSPLIKIVTKVNWKESHVLVKAAFNLKVETEFATCEIPCGVITRPTQPQTPQEKAKWEIPALRWVDLSNTDFGVSLINDCKYGYDIQPSRLRLTLLRSPEWPDPKADRDFHEFTYALYPHSGDWKQANVVRRGYELNIPLQIMILPSRENKNTSLPPKGSFFDFSAENIILMAFKQSEDNSKEWILRCYEGSGETAKLEFKSDLLEVVKKRRVDLLERSHSPINERENIIISPWEIASFAVEVKAK